jgi:hypothetical protein
VAIELWQGIGVNVMQIEVLFDRKTVLNLSSASPRTHGVPSLTRSDITNSSSPQSTTDHVWEDQSHVIMAYFRLCGGIFYWW